MTQIFSHEAIGQYIYGQVSHGAPLEETFVYGRDQVMYARNTLCSYSPSLQNLIGSEAQQFLDSTTPEEDLAQIRFQIKIMQYRNIRIALVEE